MEQAIEGYCLLKYGRAERLTVIEARADQLSPCLTHHAPGHRNRTTAETRKLRRARAAAYAARIAESAARFVTRMAVGG